MLSVKVKTEKMRLVIPVPYMLLTAGVTIISSERLQKLINNWIVGRSEEKGKVKAFVMPPLDKKELRGIVTELRKHKGLGLVNVKAKDGTEVIVKL